MATMRRPRCCPPPRWGRRPGFNSNSPLRKQFYGMSLFTGTAGRGGFGGGPSNQNLETSENGQDFRVLASFPSAARTISFAPVTARFFRFTVLSQSPSEGSDLLDADRVERAGRRSPVADALDAGRAPARRQALRSPNLLCTLRLT